MTEQDYVFAATEDSLEGERLALLGSLYDDASHRFIRDTCSLDGARVLEIGAGNGSVAMWLADQVGPSGIVLATDIDVRFLERLSHPQLEVLRHDIVTEPLAGDFDVIHGRLVLHHVFASAVEVVDKLYDALRVDGCMVFEEPDMGTAWAADRDHPAASSWERMRAIASPGLRELGMLDIEFGRRLPRLLGESNLTGVRSTAMYGISAPGSDYQRFMELTSISGRAGMEQVPGLTPQLLDECLAALRDPTFHVGEMSFVRAVGYRR